MQPLRAVLEKIAVKVGLLPSKKICGIWLTESPLKTMKNVVYFVLKAGFVLKIPVCVTASW